MKLFAASLLSTLVLLHANAKVDGDDDLVSARLVIHGLPADLSPQEVEMVYQVVAPPSVSPVPTKKTSSLRAARVLVTVEENEANEEEANEEPNELVGKSAPVPPPRKGSTCGGWGCGGYDPNNPQHQRSRWWGFGPDWSCGPTCKNDDLLLETTMATLLLEAPVATLASAKQVCQQLQQSKSPVLSQAQHCSFSILEAPGNVASLCVNGTQMGQALVFVDGLQEDAWTDQAADVLAQSVVTAYNQVYASSKQPLASFTTLHTATPPTASSTVVLGEFQRRCAEDDDTKESDAATQHALLEEHLCRALRESGEPLFGSAAHCAFRTLRSRHPVMKQTAAVAAVTE